MYVSFYTEEKPKRATVERSSFILYFMPTFATTHATELNGCTCRHAPACLCVCFIYISHVTCTVHTGMLWPGVFVPMRATNYTLCVYEYSHIYVHKLFRLSLSLSLSLFLYAAHECAV